MHIKIVIDVDNHAFKGDMGGEAARILAEVIAHIEGDDELSEGDFWKFEDANGNHACRYEVKKGSVKI